MPCLIRSVAASSRWLAFTVLLSCLIASPIRGEENSYDDFRTPAAVVLGDLQAEATEEMDMQELMSEGLSSTSGGSRYWRPTDSLTKAPTMMADYFGGGQDFYGRPVNNNRTKIADNGKALPMDRVFFQYNHYSHAVAYLDTGGNFYPHENRDTISANRYTFGAEKTFQDGLWSAEVRVSLNSDVARSITTRFLETFDFTDGGNDCKLALNWKRSLYRSSETSLVVGLGTTIPTGQKVITYQNAFFRDALSDNAVHLLPFFGYFRAPSDRLFYQFFIQADFAANGNRSSSTYLPDASVTKSKLNEANLLHLDLQVGYWFCQSPDREFFQGAAALVELHGTNNLTLNEGFGTSTTVVFPPPVPTGLLTMAIGLQLDVTAMTTLQVGGTFPLTPDHYYHFDGEFTAQFNHYF